MRTSSRTMANLFALIHIPDYNDEINLNRSVHGQLLLKCRLRHTHQAARCVVYTADKRGCRRFLSTAVVDHNILSIRRQYQSLPTSLRRLPTDRHGGIVKPADGGGV